MIGFLLFAFLSGALFLEGHADGVEKVNNRLPAVRDEAGRKMQDNAPATWVSPNPPSCVVEFADLGTSLVGATQGLSGSMIACPAVFAQGITYAEQQRLC